MLRLILYLIFIITYKQTVYSTEVDKYSKCSWANSSTPCVKIEKRLTNSSNLNEKFVNKHVITKEKIDDDNYKVTDDDGNTIIVKKEELKLMGDAVNAIDGDEELLCG